MLNSKERSALRALATDIEPMTQIGKGGVSENLLKLLSDYLDAHELAKISVLRNSDQTAKELVNALAAALSAEPVCAIGSKVVLYRKSEKDGVKHLEF